MSDTADPTSSDPLLPAGLRFRLAALALRRFPPLRFIWLFRAYLRHSGWWRSARTNTPVDAGGEPLAWYTYAALEFLAPRIGPGMAVFEYGAGHSTLWWAARAASVDSVESDVEWVERLAVRLPANADLRYAALGGGYVESVHERDRRFDVIVIDGFERNACAAACLPALKPDGVIVWDNSDWEHLFADGMAFLSQQGFRRLDFGGLGPLNGYGWRTSVFYRPDNCLGI